MDVVMTNYGDKILVDDKKKNIIQYLVDHASICDFIEQILLFGSSLEDRCSENSDIDLAIISKWPIQKISGNRKFDEFMERMYAYDNYRTDYDLLYFKSYDEIVKKSKEVPICRELVQKGKVIYRQEV